MSMPALPPTQVIVPVKSAWWSKINWTSVAGPVAGLFAFFGIKDVTVDQIGSIMLGIQTAQSIITVILKTYYTGTITPASIARVPPGTG